MSLRSDLQFIADWIVPSSSVLDIGCGDGSLLAHLKDKRGVAGYGLEIDEANLVRCVEKGVNVIQRNVEVGLSDISDDFFDCVIMSQTLQAVNNAEKVLDELLRVGREVIVTFPNFAYWRNRLQLALGGRMPITRILPYHWYDSPNVHAFTLKDFEDFCREKNIEVLQRAIVNPDHRSTLLIRLMPNLLGPVAIYRMRRSNS